VTVKRARNQARLVVTFELEFDDVVWPRDALDVLRTRLNNTSDTSVSKLRIAAEKIIGKNAKVFHYTLEAAK
jgi:hypothetical protein